MKMNETQSSASAGTITKKGKSFINNNTIINNNSNHTHNEFDKTFSSFI